ncbi:MAG TPA: hypothetical protein VF623_02655 [Segetibacter sp.]|jgi:hypothetical protein
MEAISLETNDEKFLITIDRDSMSKEFVVSLIERLRLEHLAQKAEFKDEIEKLGDDIKADWWNSNKTRL